jgi:transcriptional regulator with XRE-family HTH domain
LKTLGDHIRKKRLDLLLLQAEVALQIGVDEPSVYNWERNRIFPQVHQIPKIIEFLGYNPMPTPKTLTEKLIAARENLGLTQKAMAERLGVDPTTLARWEKGKRNPSRKVWKRVQPLLLAARLQFD